MRNYADLEGHLRSDLELLIHDRSGILSDSPDFSVGAMALADSFYKKLCPMGNSTEADARALEKFLKINARCADYVGITRREHSEQESVFWDYLKGNLNAALQSDLVFPDPDDNDSGSTPYDLAFIREHMGVGPGASQLADASCMATKLFTGPISYANSDYLITVYRAALVETGLWADAEMHRFQSFGFTKVAGGKLFFAAKNSEISRTCCTEANLNMLIQKSCGEFLELRLKERFGISLSDQPDKNKELARIGSVDGSFGTIDLVSASDSIALGLFCDLFEPSFLKTMILESRSRSAVLPDGSEVPMNMVSTMGNGFTFPLQTIIFASAVKSVYQMMGYPASSSRGPWGVFGDDIVVRKETYVFLCRMLNMLGFEVNEGKSFNTGLFRESCGGDYFAGTNVRGVYIRSLETPQQVASAFNRLTRWSARSGIPIPATLRWLWGLAETLKVPLVPYSESDDAGLKVPFRLSKPQLDSDYWFRYRCLERRRKMLIMPEPDDSPNPCGYGVSFLSGHTRRSDCPLVLQGSTFSTGVVRVPVREPPQAAGRHKVRHRTIPYWDWCGVGEGGNPLSHEGWKTFMMASNFN